jgi:hypothetical protein
MSKRARARDVTFNLLKEHEKAGMLPTSNRFLYYELVQRGVIKKGDLTARDLTDALSRLRKDGTVPWEAIVDETRSVNVWRVAPTVRKWLLGVIGHARLDPWGGDPPFVLTEARSVAGVLRRHAETHAVPIAATNGWVGGFLRTDIAPLLHRDQVVLYFGDLNLSGQQIEANTRKVLEHAVGPLRWTRLALTDQQVRRYRLPKISKFDGRYKPPRPMESVETEALSQRVLENIFVQELDRRLPTFQRVLDRERRQRAKLRRELGAS